MGDDLAPSLFTFMFSVPRRRNDSGSGVKRSTVLGDILEKSNVYTCGKDAPCSLTPTLELALLHRVAENHFDNDQ